jgi:hypothetical protein
MVLFVVHDNACVFSFLCKTNEIIIIRYNDTSLDETTVEEFRI